MVFGVPFVGVLVVRVTGFAVLIVGVPVVEVLVFVVIVFAVLFVEVKNSYHASSPTWSCWET
ncbi:hypothetical protein ColTof3_14567 [Colletotrichum tofieldiae]|nr:hypothetical protein ColTof3_14567 [Colletotrichum tofieldiae]